MKTRLWTIGLAILLAALALGAARNPVRIDKRPLVQETRHFKPADPPPQMPRLTPPETAVAESKFEACVSTNTVIAQSRTTGQTTRATVRLTSLEVQITLKVILWLPEKAPRKTVVHEEGHARISDHFYQSAHEVAAAAVRPFIGRTFSGEGPDIQTAGHAATQAAARQSSDACLLAIRQPMEQVQQTYDDLTDHGRNSLDEDEAIRRALARHEKKAPATSQVR